MDKSEIIQAKLFERKELRKRLNIWRFRDHKIVFTNGCFDLIHRGHIHFLTQAANLGDRLIIGLNSDESVSQLKGDDRPVNDLETRQMILASFFFVHGVIVFEEETPYDLIQFVQPDVLVKGSDYEKDEIVGADLVEQNGGEVKQIDLMKGYSTTAIEEKIKTTR